MISFDVFNTCDVTYWYILAGLTTVFMWTVITITLSRVPATGTIATRDRMPAVAVIAWIGWIGSLLW